MAGCAFRLPVLLAVVLSIAFPSVPGIPTFSVTVPGIRLRLAIPGVKLPSLSLALPALLLLPFLVRVPGIRLALRLPAPGLPALSLALPSVPGVSLLKVRCPLK